MKRMIFTSLNPDKQIENFKCTQEKKHFSFEKCFYQSGVGGVFLDFIHFARLSARHYAQNKLLTLLECEKRKKEVITLPFN